MTGSEPALPRPSQPISRTSRTSRSSAAGRSRSCSTRCARPRARAISCPSRSGCVRARGGYWRVPINILAIASASRCSSLEVLTGKLIRTVKVDGRVDEIFELQVSYCLRRDPRPGSEAGEGRRRCDRTRRDALGRRAFSATSARSPPRPPWARRAMDRAIGLFERAVTLDPTYATAWSALVGRTT